jgi:phospholipid/cholesterol/gamma-HCH transport system substrate-binding protein
MKKFFTREVKIGLTFVIAIAVLFFGLNFLKGINIFTPTNRYFATFEDVGGLVVSNSVMIKGYKVGQVRSIEYDFKKQRPFVVEIAVNDDIKLPKGTIVNLMDEGLIGGKIIDIQLGNKPDLFVSGDTIETFVIGNFLAQLTDYMPKIAQILDNLDSTVVSVNALVNSPSLQSGINSFGSTMENLSRTMAQLRLATASLPSTMSKLDNVAANLDTKVNQLDIAKLMTSINQTLENVRNFSDKLTSKNSSLGLLMNDRGVYDNLNATVQSANALMVDFKANPKRYIHFSVFGGKSK